jgi:hypothetical protein
MAKRNKTRKEKKLADLRHQQFSFEPQYKLEEVVQKKEPPISSGKIDSPTSVYLHVYEDLRRTGLIMSLILFFQIALWALLKSHVYRLPIINY